MSYPDVAPINVNPGHSGFSAPTMGENGGRSVWSSIGRAAGKACAMPFRLASTVVNGGIFAAYYVTAVAVTGLAATGGTVFGIAKIATDVVRGKPHKSLREYAITPARETFNFISRMYYELPKHGSEIIFAGLAIATVSTLALIAGGSGNSNCFVWIEIPRYYDSGDGGHKGYRERPDDDYNPSGFAAALYPYRPSIVLGRKIMGKTTQALNRGQKAD
ncbi:hypothetical protein [Endozoicomonas sp. YOMI1]|uniref:hypothetical protein n=1 Tax=Endozoicomonas sp. YOMI1 TaxID=2828739 RepID=UPI002147D77E|nr:hypothetical protein [Endozoicomonas sp. YOMI1]